MKKQQALERILEMTLREQITRLQQERAILLARIKELVGSCPLNIDPDDEAAYQRCETKMPCKDCIAAGEG